MKLTDVDQQKLSPMMRQYVEIKKQYMDSIVFFRLGDFYEMFFEDALTCSKELELTLTGKSAGLTERVPMCGIPYHAYQSYLDKLITKGYKVAICEQTSDPKEKGMVEREVIQVITKGTRIGEGLDAKDNNYICNIYDFEYCYGLSYTDISTGQFYVEILENDDEQLIREVVKREVQEIIVNSKINRFLINHFRNKEHILVTIQDEILENNVYDYIYENIKDIRLVTTIKHLLYYLNNTKMTLLSHLQTAQIIEKNQYLALDIYTKKNLELCETIRLKERTYSLLWLLDKNKTAMGSRLLKYNIENPLRDIKKITNRYDMIDKLRTEFILREELIDLLNSVYDLERLAGKVSYGNVNARDLLQLKNSLKVLPNINNILKQLEFKHILPSFDDIYDLLEKAIYQDPPISIKEGSLIKEGYNKELDELKKLRSGSKEWILKLEKEEKERTGIKNLKIGFNKVFGYYIEVSKGSLSLMKDEYGYERKQTLANCERYTNNLLKEKENIILGAEEKIIELEYQLFIEIKDIIKEHIPKLQLASKIIAEIDLLQSFATIAEQNNYVRPIITKDRNIDIIDSRHPVIEKVSQNDYVPNDIKMNADTFILLITGPNMAGKSTYMRQLAIIVIMAQIGCFVPAKSCHIPLFDKIFTRIGASDDLVSGESTFMVEMKEANRALEEATANSLILFDELGRGTATYDGMSLAQAILEYIHDEIHAKTLFSTHYHELTDLANKLPHLKNVHVSAIEEEGNITFLHKIKNGAVDKSYGIHVAKLAKLPPKVIKRSQEILNMYETNNKKEIPKFLQTTLELDNSTPKIEEELITKIKNINPLEMTPIMALNFISQLHDEANKK